MRIIGYTVCVDYQDIFRLTWNYNRRFFDEIIVVTSPFDESTKYFCKANNIKCIESMAFKDDGATFNRSAMLNEALKYLADRSFLGATDLCCFDADTIIHKIDGHNMEFGNGFTTARIEGYGKGVSIPIEEARNPDCCYGAPREVVKYEDCLNGISLDGLIKISKLFNYPYEQYGYVGHFQFYNKREARFDESVKGVNDSDTAFVRKNFKYIRTLSNIICYHLGETEKNWNGRVTQDWSSIKCVD